MSGDNELNGDSNPATSVRKRWNSIGVGVLLAGLIAAAILYAAAPATPAASPYSVADPRYQIELQRIGGNAAVLMAQLHQWFDSLWHGRALAYTVAVLGAALAGGCFFVGFFLADEEAPR
ncbi:hypothetical protein [Paraburkholderia sp. BCC1886]|uniref:hypothetical protein n=1 Tax=Paraburkholderia sp. BCC1886 TaxID=2562670 RepID=UPI001183953D|nr:hypothetical protein [Paraburkholderia sp. BCC1886]